MRTSAARCLDAARAGCAAHRARLPVQVWENTAIGRHGAPLVERAAL